jgi:adenylate cyclase
MVVARARICQGCWQRMHMPIPLRGVASVPFRAFGIRRSRMNPNTCTICEMMFSRMMKSRQVTIDATVLFADLRGYTGLSQSQSAAAVSEVLDAFYDECAEAIWEHDGLLNKTMGDAVMAVFNFPIRRDDHPIQAVLAARAIQERWKARRHHRRGGNNRPRKAGGRHRHRYRQRRSEIWRVRSNASGSHGDRNRS